MFDPFISSLIEKLIKTEDFKIDENSARKLVELPDSALMDIFLGANKILRQFKGEDIFTCTIINAKSGRCSQDCAFCAQSAHHDTRISTYPLLTRQEMVDRALEMADAGATNFSMVTSGFQLTDAEIETICETAAEIKERTGMVLCSSIGVIDAKRAEMLVQSGIIHYHHNLETAQSHFKSICSTHEYKDDIAAIRVAADAGLSVCSGGIFGLGETWAQRVELAMTLRDIGVSRIPLNFINPIPGTPLENSPLLSPMEALKCIALFRFILPDRDITICGGRDVTLKDYQSWIFLAGANGVMAGNYLTTSGRNIVSDMEMISAWKR